MAKKSDEQMLTELAESYIEQSVDLTTRAHNHILQASKSHAIPQRMSHLDSANAFLRRATNTTHEAWGIYYEQTQEGIEQLQSVKKRNS